MKTIILPETQPRVKLNYKFKRKTSFALQWQEGYLPAKINEIRGLR